MENEDIVKFLRLKEAESNHVLKSLYRYPDIEFNVDCDIKELEEGDEEVIKVSLKRLEIEEEESLGEVICFAYPFKKTIEYWWIVVGDPTKNKVVGIKRVNFEHQIDTKVTITAPEPGDYNLTVYLICDSYIGCDQEVSPLSPNPLLIERSVCCQGN